MKSEKKVPYWAKVLLILILTVAACALLRRLLPERFKEPLTMFPATVFFTVGLLPGMLRLAKNPSKNLAYKWVLWVGYLFLAIAMLGGFSLQLWIALSPSS